MLRTADTFAIPPELAGETAATSQEAMQLTTERMMAPASQRGVPDVPGAMLSALATMARLSLRGQAEMQVALHRAGLILSPTQQAAAMKQLFERGLICAVIKLDDGGVLMTVTSAGMQRTG